jgi:radical SAM protein with 4Fe4S-binding SPASM domain
MGDSGRFDLFPTKGDDKDECDHIVSTMTVRADGTIVPCCYDLTSQLPMGNIHTDSLQNIWHNEQYQKLRESIKTKKFYSICANCATVRPPIYLVPKWDAINLADS